MQTWKDEAKELRFIDNCSWTETADIIRRKYFPNEPQQTIHERVRGYLRNAPEYKGEKRIFGERPRIVGTIGDLHCPFNHPNYLSFLLDTFDKWNVTDVIYIGDVVDLHALSRHQTEPVAKGVVSEYNLAIKELHKYYEAFPKARICIGNHDKIPERQAATLGMPEIFLRSFRDLWELPEGYEVDNHFIIDDVMYHHGTNACGINGAINKALNERMSVVQGHEHSSFKIDYRANARDIIFGCSCGCGVDNTAYAFEYGKLAPRKPILGTAIIKSSSEAYLVPMGAEYFRSA